MEFRRLKASDLSSLLELYKQLDADDSVCPIDQYDIATKRSCRAEQPGQKHIAFMRI